MPTPTLSFLPVSTSGFKFGPVTDSGSLLSFVSSLTHQGNVVIIAQAVQSSGSLGSSHLPFDYAHMNAGFQAAYNAAIGAGEDDAHAQEMAKHAAMAYAQAIKQGASPAEALILATAASITGGGILHGLQACGVDAAAIAAELALFAEQVLELAATAGSAAVAATLAYLVGQTITSWGLPTP